MSVVHVLVGASPLTGMIVVFASDEEERLMMDVFRGYNYLIQPVKNISEIPLIVKIALQLVLLINVDEKDQIMHTNVWLTLVGSLLSPYMISQLEMVRLSNEVESG